MVQGQVQSCRARREALFLRFDQIAESLKGVVFQRRLLPTVRSSAAMVAAGPRLLVLVIVAIEAQEFPVAAVRRVVSMVVVLMMDREFAETLTFELPATASADMREERKRAFAITLLALVAVPPRVGENLGALFEIGFLLLGCHGRV